MAKGDICKAPGCERIVEGARKACSMHHQRWRYYKSYELPHKPDIKPGYVKACRIHGQLKPEDCLILKRNRAKVYKNTTWNIYRCKVCARDRYFRWRKKNPDKRREEYLKTRFSQNYIKTGRKLWLKKKFGITLEQYEEMFNRQKGLCGACDKPETQINKKSGLVRMLAVDHNHQTGKIRQLLCNKCNVGLGVVDDSIEWLEKLIIYLRRHSS